MHPRDLLASIADVEERIRVVAFDLKTGNDWFKELDPRELAHLLDVDPLAGDAGWTRVEVAEPCHLSTHDLVGEGLYRELERLVSPRRYRALLERAEAIQIGARSGPLKLRPVEKERLENVLSARSLVCGGWTIAMRILKAPGAATAPEFMVELGDAGDCRRIFGPYEIRDGDSPWDSELYTGRSW